MTQQTTVESDFAEISKPRTTGAVAKTLGISSRYFMLLVERGYIPRLQYGQFSIPDAAQGYIKFLKETLKAETKKKTQAGINEWQRRKLEMQVRKARGQLIEASFLDETMQTMCAELVSLLESQPGRLANEVAGLSEPAVIREVIQDENRRIRAAIAAYLERRAEALRAIQDMDSDMDAAAEEETLGMGGGEPGAAGGERGTGAVSLEEDALREAATGRVRRPSVSKGRRGDGDADEQDRVLPKRHRA